MEPETTSIYVNQFFGAIIACTVLAGYVTVARSPGFLCGRRYIYNSGNAFCQHVDLEL